MPKKRNRGDTGYSDGMGYAPKGGKATRGSSSGWSNPMGSVGTSKSCTNVVDGNGGVAGSVSLRSKGGSVAKGPKSSMGSKHYAGNYQD